MVSRQAKDFSTRRDTVVEAYEKAGLTEDDALVTARLARILRAEDYDGVNIKLWEPKR